MNRRGFLGAMLGVMAAPAIVRADSLMRIVVPKQELIVPEEGIFRFMASEEWVYEPGQCGGHDWHSGSLGARHDRALMPDARFFTDFYTPTHNDIGKTLHITELYSPRPKVLMR